MNASDIRVYLRDSTIQKANTKGTVTFALANVNNGDARFVQMTVEPSNDYEILSKSNYFYIGDMSADDTESQEIEVFVKDTSKDKIIFPVKIEYKDPDETKYTKNVDVELRLYNANELKLFGFEKPSNMLYISIVLLVVLIVLIFWYRRRKAKK